MRVCGKQLRSICSIFQCFRLHKCIYSTQFLKYHFKFDANVLNIMKLNFIRDFKLKQLKALLPPAQVVFSYRHHCLSSKALKLICSRALRFFLLCCNILFHSFVVWFRDIVPTLSWTPMPLFVHTRCETTAKYCNSWHNLSAIDFIIDIYILLFSSQCNVSSEIKKKKKKQHTMEEWQSRHWLASVPTTRGKKTASLLRCFSFSFSSSCMCRTWHVFTSFPYVHAQLEP